MAKTVADKCGPSPSIKNVMLISHMSEDDEINFYPPWAGGLIGKGLS